MTGDKDRLKQYLLQTILRQIINKKYLGVFAPIFYVPVDNELSFLKHQLSPFSNTEMP